MILGRAKTCLLTAISGTRIVVPSAEAVAVRYPRDTQTQDAH